MGKTVRKLLLNDGWRIGKNESWFSDMAAKGLHLKSMGHIFAVFEKGEASNTKYRIDVLRQKPSQEQLEVYKECGWDFVTGKYCFYIFSSLESAGFPELHTDPAEQSYTLIDLDRRLRNNLIMISLLMLLFFGMMFVIFFLDKRPFLSMTEGSFVQRILLVTAELYVFYTVIRNYAGAHKLKKSLSEGKPVNHREDWKKSRFINGAVGILFLAIAVFSIFNPVTQMVKSREYTLPEASADLPVVRLKEMEQNPALERKIVYSAKGVDWGNSVHYDWSLLAPIQYEVDEHGIVSDEMWEDKSGLYSPSVHTQFYRLVFSEMANGLIHDLMKKYLYKPDIIPQKLENASFDQVYIAVDGVEKQIFACRNNNVIYVRYYGNKGVDRILSGISKVMAE